MSRSPIQAVLFDVDDTLIDFRASAAAGIAELLADLVPGGLPRDGLDAVWHELTERHYPRFLAGDIGFADMQVARLSELLAWAGAPAADQDRLLALEERRQQTMTRNYRLFDDVLPCLAALGDLPVGVVSNSDGPHQRAKLAGVGLTDRFPVVVISGDVGHPKPDPRIFIAACDRLGLPPAAVAYVGDRLDVDAVGAVDAGLVGVWLGRGRPTTELRAAETTHAEVRAIAGLADLPDLIRALARAR